MKLKELLSIVKTSADENQLSQPFIVGGFPRDMILKKIDDIRDIDITCGDDSSTKLGPILVKKLPGSVLNTFNDGHSRLVYGKISLDFSNNFRIPNIDSILQKEEVEYSKPIYEEVYSRDFTANALLMPTDLSNIVDITNRGITDISKKILDTCLAPEITLHYDPKRIVRVIYLCAKLGFTPSERIIVWTQKNANMLSKVNNFFMKNKINKALVYDKNLTIDLVRKMNLSNYLPKSEAMVQSWL